MSSRLMAFGRSEYWTVSSVDAVPAMSLTDVTRQFRTNLQLTGIAAGKVTGLLERSTATEFASLNL
jgi:hypothetical protein